jgi:hypothetical protein
MPPKVATPKKIPTRSNQPQKSYRHIAVVFIILAIVLILGVTYLALSKATITLIPSNEPVTHNFVLTIADNPANNTSTIVVIKGEIFSESKEVEQLFSVEEGKTIDAQAEGTITIYNDRSTDQALVATTRFLTPDGRLFRLKEKVTVPAGSSVQAKIHADEKGASGNIPPTTFTIPGLSESLQRIVYGKSTTPMTGGTRQVGILTSSDIERAELEFNKTNTENIVAKFLSDLSDSKLILIDTTGSSTELATDQEVGTEVDSFNLTGNLTVQSIFASKDEILNLASAKLKDSLGGKGEFVSVDPSSLEYELIDIDPEKKEARVKITISGLTTLDPEKNIFDKNLLVGFTEEDLKLYFSQFESIKDIRVEFSPFWVKKVPILKDHININVKK